MPRAGNTFSLTGANAHTQLANGAGSAEQSLNLERECVAVILSIPTASPGDAFVTFNNTAAASTNGLNVIKGAQPVLIPLGWMAHSGRVLRYQGSAASSFLNVTQMT